MGSPYESVKTTRNYQKCQQCRSDRKACVREPHSPNERCSRCARLDHPCGPPVTARTTKRRRGYAVEMDSHTKDRDRSSATSDDHLAFKVTEEWLPGRVPDFGRGFHALAVSIAAQRLFTRCRQDNRTCLDFLSPSLPDAANLVVQDLQRLDKRLDCLIRHLQEYQLYGHQESWLCRKDIQRMSNSDITSSIDQKSGDFKVLLCSANVLDHSARGCSKGRKNVILCHDKFDKDHYKSTEKAIRDLMESIPICIRVDNSFPASHIAYLNGDKETAFNLWAERVATSGSHVDVLGRTFPHLVAEAGDAELFQRMGTLFLENISLDRRGFSVLGLAVISNNETIVNMILNENIAFLNFTEAMQRAIRTNRPRIASKIFPTRLRSSPSAVSNETDVPENLTRNCEHDDLQDLLDTYFLAGSSWTDFYPGLDAFDYASVYRSSPSSDFATRCTPDNSPDSIFPQSQSASASVSKTLLEDTPYDFHACLAYPTTLDICNSNSTEIRTYDATN